MPARDPRAVLEALRARARSHSDGTAQPAGHPGKTEAGAIDVRIREVDGLLEKVRSHLRQPPPRDDGEARPPPDLNELAGRLRETSELMRAQSERLDRIEQSFADGSQSWDEALSWQKHWETALEDIRVRLDERLESLSGHLAGLREHERALRGGDKESRQNLVERVGRRLLIGLVLLGFLTVGLLTLSWWLTSQRLDRFEIAQRADIAKIGQDLQAHLDRLTQSSRELQHREERIMQLARGLGDKVEDLVKDQGMVRQAGARLAATGTSPAAGGSTPHAQTSAEAAQPASDAQHNAPEQTPTTAGAADTRYTIQLIGFRNKSSVAPFARRFALTGKASYLEEASRGKDWYSVVLGDYKDYQDAAAAADKLPPELKELEPWIRSIPEGVDLHPIPGS